MLLFLAFDGVLHPALDATEPDSCRLPLLESVRRAAPRVRIVIASTWREAFPLDELPGLFAPSIAVAEPVGSRRSLVGGALVRALRRGLRLDWHAARGVAHWARVNGLALATQTGADPRAVALFAVFHDCGRQSEGDDPWHGARAARRQEDLRPRLPELLPQQSAPLEEACSGHTGGRAPAAARRADTIAAARARALAGLKLRDRRRGRRP
jgi:hypothetical protein